MTAEEYAISYFSNSDNISNNHLAFLEEFANEFKTKVADSDNYVGFNIAIADMYQLFKDILINKYRKGYMSYKLWKAFFAIYVVPVRKELYPEKQDAIDKRKNMRLLRNSLQMFNIQEQNVDTCVYCFV